MLRNRDETGGTCEKEVTRQGKERSGWRKKSVKRREERERED